MQLKNKEEEEIEEEETMTAEVVAFMSSQPVSPGGGILISSDRKFSASPAGQLECVKSHYFALLEAF